MATSRLNRTRTDKFRSFKKVELGTDSGLSQALLSVVYISANLIFPYATSGVGHAKETDLSSLGYTILKICKDIVLKFQFII